MLDGFATPSGTNRYSERFPLLREHGHFRQQKQVPGASELSLSSIGIGTYLGEPSDEADLEYIDAIVAALRSGVNVLDTAINYRHQRSERNIGEALRRLSNSQELSRDEVLICTKAGYLSFDGNVPTDPHAYFQQQYVTTGILDPTQIAGGMHCMAPKYLANQIERSRKNLGLTTIDVFYVHNPESQLGEISRDVFNQRLRSAFTMLEEAVAQGKIRFYGVATWGAFRLPQGSRDCLGLPELVKIAEDIAGTGHHFRFVQLPFNLAMSEAFALTNQMLDGKTVPVLAAANALGIAVIGSATLYQGQLTRGLPNFVGKALGTRSDSETAIQFSRSAPGITTSLVGMGQKEHVERNLKLAAQQPATREKWMSLFSDKERTG